MNRSYKVVIVEDQAADAELIELQLRKANLIIKTDIVQSESDLRQVLKEGGVDLIISDYNLNEEFTGKDVLATVKSYSGELPFILVSGYLGEKKAVEMMVNGANDFVLKDDLERLGPAVSREIDRYVKYQRQQKIIKNAYSLAEIGHWEVNLETGRVFWSKSVKRIFEVDEDFSPTLEVAVSFAQNGYHRDKVNEGIKSAIEENKEYKIESLITTAKGNKRWIRTIGKPEMVNGSCVLLYGSVQNITELKEAEHKLQDIFTHSTNLFYRHDIHHRFTYLSPKTVQFLGCAPEEAMHISWKEFLTDHPVNQKGVDRTNEAIRTGTDQPSYKLQLRKKGGETIWVRVHEAPIVEDGETVAVVGALTDINELVEAEEQQKLLARIASETNNIVIITDNEQNIEWVNKAFEDHTGYKLDEIIEKNPRFLQGPDTNPDTTEYIRAEIEAHNYVSTEILNYTKSGESYWNKLTISPIKNEYGQVEKYFSIQTDITKQKLYVSYLTEQQERLKEAQMLGKIGDWDYDFETGMITWSDQIFKIFDRDPELGPPAYDELLGYYVDNGESLHKSVEKALKEGDGYEFDLQIVTNKGIKKHIYHQGYVETDENGKSINLHGIVQDVTERKEKELEVLNKQKELQSITDNIDALIFQYILKDDGTDQMLYISDNIEKIYEVSAEETMQSTRVIWDQIDKRDLQRVLDEIQESVDKMSMWDSRFRVETPSGKQKWLHGRGNPSKQDDGSIRWNVVILDITTQIEQEKMNEALVQEIHHRVQNNLAIITGFLELQLIDLDENRRERLPLERAITRIYSIAEVHKLLYDDSTLVGIPVQEYIQRLVDHVTNTMKIGDTYSFDLQVDALQMNVNELTPLGMLLNELLTNSMKYAFKDQEQGKINIGISKTDHTYSVVYEDNGPGIEEETFEEAVTSGLNIVKILLSQLEAEYQLIKRDGFSLSFTFKERERGAHANKLI